MRKWFRIGATYGAVAILALVLSELVLGFLLDHSALLRFLPLESLRSYYMEADRKIIQFLPECAAYDAELSYRLRPGRCRFGNREFDVVFDVNRLGVRDDEASLDRPEIIVIGDSHAMGWGVGHEATFAQLVEEETGRRVLNAAVSSYGTVRELAILAEVDAGALRTLVIQYCDNDYRENKTFRDEGALSIMPEARYRRIVERRSQAARYYFGKHLVGITRRATGLGKASAKTSRAATSPDAGARPPDEAECFLHALAHAPVDLRGVRILVFEIDGHGVADDGLITGLDAYPADGPYAEIARDLETIDLSAVLGPGDFFVLDDHMTARGHRVVADKLVERLRRLSR